MNYHYKQIKEILDLKNPIEVNNNESNVQEIKNQYLDELKQIFELPKI